MTTHTLPHDVHHPACDCVDCDDARADRTRDAYWRVVITRMLAGAALGWSATYLADHAGALAALGWPL